MGARAEGQAGARGDAMSRARWDDERPRRRRDWDDDPDDYDGREWDDRRYRDAAGHGGVIAVGVLNLIVGSLALLLGLCMVMVGLVTVDRGGSLRMIPGVAEVYAFVLAVFF